MRFMVPALSILMPLVMAGCTTPPDQPRGPNGEVKGALARITVMQQHRQAVVDINAKDGSLPRAAQAKLKDFIGQTLPDDRAAIHFYLRSAASPTLLAAIDRAIVNAGGDANKIMYQQAATPLVLDSAPKKGPGTLPVEVTAVTYVAHAPNCPINTHLDTMDGSNTPTSNFGCAYANMFAAQVADPADLVHGEAGGATDSVLTSGAIQRLRDNKTTPFTDLQSTQGAVGG